MVQAGPSDIPNACAVCGTVTLHRPSPSDGRLHCMQCMMRMMAVAPQALTPQVQPPTLPPVIQVQQKAGGGVVRGTIDAAKFMVSLLFLLMLGTCVYVCGSAAKATKDVSSSSSSP